MKKIFFLALTLLFLNCENKSELQKFYNCNSTSNLGELETIQDFKKIIKLKIPKNWKTNIYFDESKSSLQIADTTKNLTSSSLIGVSIVHTSVNLSTEFQQKIQQENTTNGLENIFSKATIFKEKPAFINVAKGKRGKYPYQITNIFAQLNDSNFLQISTEVYGDSLVSQRFCDALFLIEKIQLN